MDAYNNEDDSNSIIYDIYLCINNVTGDAWQNFHLLIILTIKLSQIM